MAERPDAVLVASLNTTSNASSYTSSTGTPSANKRLYALINLHENSSVVPDITDANVSGWGLTWTRVSPDNFYATSGTTHRLVIFYADTGGTSPGSGAFSTGTLTNGTAPGCQMAIVEVSMFDTTEPHETTNIQADPDTADTSGTSLSVTMNALGASLHRYLAIFGVDSNVVPTPSDSAAVTVDSGTITNPAAGFIVLLGPPNDSSPAATIGASAVWGGLALELKAGTEPTGFPDIAEEDTATTAESANGTTHTLSLPSNIASGDLLFIFACSDGGVTYSNKPAGWTTLYEDTDGTAERGIILYKTAAGTEGASVTIDTSASEMMSAVAVRVKSGTWTGTPEITAGAEATNAAPDPGSLTPSWGSAKTLWLAGFLADDNNAQATLYYPTAGYDPVGLAVSSNATEGASVGLAQRRTEAASEDPGAFALGGSHVHTTFTIGIEPASSGGTTVTVDTPGAVTFTGQATATNLAIAVTAGALTFAGSAVTLTTTVPVEAGAVTLAGQGVTLTTTVPVTAGALTLAGATDIVTGAVTTIEVDTPGAITLTGQAVTFTTTCAVTPGALTLAGAPDIVTGSITRVDVDVPGAVTLAGQDVAFATTLAVQAGGMTLAGSAVGVGLTVPANAGALTLVGQSVSFATLVALEPGNITFAGQTVSASDSGAEVSTTELAGAFAGEVVVGASYGATLSLRAGVEPDA